ncbi:MAG: 50S ribosomal protein L11 methyltransferase [Xanthobacteraceae bacterium]|uniref:50S ribosomal protein L11 methyltransferase n=1 Tax=Pseudolabrys sp. TaxID=1960880 RepID=UPI003D0F1514
MPTAVARLACDEDTARRIAGAVGETLPEDTACSAFEIAEGRWMAEIFFHDAPDHTIVETLVRAAGGDPARLVYDAVSERDWVQASLEGLAPVRAGRFVVHGSHDRARIAPNATRIEIEAALAFGTGHHGTTRGCLLAFDAVLKRRRFRRVLDVGAGTGVLAISAAKALRRPVIGTDIDPVAVAAARSNARLNGVPSLTTYLHANGCRAGSIRNRGPYDLIFANILLGPLRGMAQPLTALVAAGGTVILSGLLTADGRAALARYRAAGLILEARVPLEGWVTLIMRRPGRRPVRRR